jgi:hypothetical protein
MHEDLVKEKAEVVALKAKLKERDSEWQDKDREHLITIDKLQAELRKLKSEKQSRQEQRKAEFKDMLKSLDNEALLTGKIQTLVNGTKFAEAIKEKCSQVFGEYIDEKEAGFDAERKADLESRAKPAAALPSDIDKLREMVDKAMIERNGNPKWNLSVDSLEKRLKTLEDKKKPK